MRMLTGSDKVLNKRIISASYVWQTCQSTQAAVSQEQQWTRAKLLQSAHTDTCKYQERGERRAKAWGVRGKKCNNKRKWKVRKKRRRGDKSCLLRSQQVHQGWNMTFMWTGSGHNPNNCFTKRRLFVKWSFGGSCCKVWVTVKPRTKPGNKLVIWGIGFRVLLKRHGGGEWSLCGGYGLQAHLHAVINVVYTGHAALWSGG